MPKCQWCKENGEKETMICDEKPTGKYNKNGTEKVIRKYTHHSCYEEFIRDKEFKQQEAIELDQLYQYLLKLHSLNVLDKRMFEKIQDLRNGTIKINNKKIAKYKNGVKYTLMLDTYIYLQQRIDDVLRNMQFETKWNEFSYIFGMMINNLNEVQVATKLQEKVNMPKQINVDSVEIKVNTKEKKRKDDLDISNFL